MITMLICHRGALGDFILTWPALHALRKVLPAVHFWGVGRSGYMRLAIRVGLLDSCLDAESAVMAPFFAGKGIPQELGAPAGALLWLAEGDGVAGLLKGSASLPVALIPPFPRMRMHVAFHHYQAVREHFTLERAQTLSPCFPLGIEREGYALIHSGSGSPSKNYHPHLYRTIADMLRHAGYGHVRFIAGPAEDFHAMKALAGERIERPEDAEALAWLLAGASLYVGNDSGVSHLAGVLGIPTIALYKTTDPAVWGVLGRSVVNIQAGDEAQALERIQAFLR